MHNETATKIRSMRPLICRVEEAMLWDREVDEADIVDEVDPVDVGFGAEVMVPSVLEIGVGTVVLGN